MDQSNSTSNISESYIVDQVAARLQKLVPDDYKVQAACIGYDDWHLALFVPRELFARIEDRPAGWPWLDQVRTLLNLPFEIPDSFEGYRIMVNKELPKYNLEDLRDVTWEEVIQAGPNYVLFGGGGSTGFQIAPLLNWREKPV